MVTYLENELGESTNEDMENFNKETDEQLEELVEENEDEITVLVV